MACENTYNKFEQLRGASNTIISYLMENNQNLFKLLKYITPQTNPYSQPDMTFSEKVAMIARNSYDTNDSVTKNILFITETREAFTTNVAQLRIEVDAIKAINSYTGFMNVWFQIIVPISADVMENTTITGERRTDAIFLELADTLNGTTIPNSGFHSPMFINNSAPDRAGQENGSYRKQANTDYTQRWVCFSVLV